MSIQSDFFRRSISRLLVTSILCSSFSPCFAMMNNDDDGDAGVVSVKAATPAQVPVSEEVQVFPKESCRGVDIDFLTEEGKEIYAAALFQEVLELKDSPVLDIVIASMNDHERQRMKLVSKDWRKAIETSEGRVSTTRIRLTYSNDSMFKFDAEKMDMIRTAYYRVGEALYTEEQLRSFRMKKFAHLVFDDVALTGGDLKDLSWGTNTSVEIEVLDAQALQRLLARTAEKTALHVGVALSLTDRELTSEGKLTDKAITDPLLRNDQTQSYQSLEDFLTRVGGEAQQESSWVKPSTPCPVFPQADAMTEDDRKRLNIWKKQRLQELAQNETVRQDARTFMDLASLAVDVDSVSTAVKLLTRIHALRNLRTTPPMITLFINQFVEEFTSHPDLQNNTETKKGAKSEDVKELRALEQKLAAQLKLFSLNDVYEGVKGQIVFDPTVGLHWQGRLSLAGIFEVIDPILQKMQTSEERSTIFWYMKGLTARASTLRDVLSYIEQLPTMYTLPGDAWWRNALIDIPPSKRPMLVDAVNSTLNTFIAEARQQPGAQKTDLQWQIDFRPVAIGLKALIEVISLDDYQEWKPHLLNLVRSPLQARNLLEIPRRDRLSCGLSLFAFSSIILDAEGQNALLGILKQIPSGERRAVSSLAARYYYKFLGRQLIDVVKVINVLKAVPSDQRAQFLENELSTPDERVLLIRQ